MVESSGRYMKIGETRFQIRDRDVPISYVDVFTEANIVHGVLNLSLGAAFNEGDGNEPIVDTVCRLRMNVVTAQVIRAELDRFIQAMEAGPDKSKAN